MKAGEPYIMTKNAVNSEDNGFLFNVDLLVKCPSNAQALQKLLELINSSDDIIDFRIKSGIELGGIIDNLLQAKKQSVISKASLAASQTDRNAVKKNSTLKVPAEKKTPAVKEQQPEYTSNQVLPEPDPYSWIRTFSKDNRLVRLTANRRGKQLSLPCRILNYDEDTSLVSVYHVDEKQVYTFNVNEIDAYNAV